MACPHVGETPKLQVRWKNYLHRVITTTSQSIWYQFIHSDISSELLFGIYLTFYLAVYPTLALMYILTVYLSGTLPGTFSDITFYSIWHLFWHSIWHLVWHSIWHFFWHLFRHSIQHFIWLSILGINGILSDILSDTSDIRFILHSFCYFFWQSI